MSDLLDEVDEAMRQEKMEKIWREYGSSIITFIVATILFTAGFSGYETWNANTQEKQTQTIISLSEADNFPDNITPEELKLRASPRGILLLMAAGEYVRQGKQEDALKLYKATAQDTKIPSEYRDLAAIMQNRINQTENSIENLRAIINSKSPWKPHAYIDLALLELKNGNTANAQTYLKAVEAIDGLPDTLYKRAKTIEQTITDTATQ